MIADRERFDSHARPHAHTAKGNIPPDDLSPDARATLHSIVHDATRFLGCPRGALMVLEADAGELRTVASQGFDRAPHPPRLALNQGLPGWVAVHRVSAQIDDLARDDRRQVYPDGQRTGAALCLPLVEDATLFGVLAVYHDQAQAFGARHRDLLAVFAAYATVALARARQTAAAQGQQRQLALFVDAARAMTGLLAPSEMFANIAGGIRQIVAYDDALIFVAEAGGEELRVVAGLGAEGERVIDRRVRVADTASLAARVARQRCSCVHAPDTHSLLPGRVTEAFLGGRERALLCVPLISKATLRGVVTLARPTVFTPDELRAMDDLAPLVATAIENATLYRAVTAEQERLAAIFGATADGIVVVDGQAHVVEANAAFARMCGRSAAAMPGTPLLAAFAPPGAPPDATRTDLGPLATALREALAERGTPALLECTLPGAPDTQGRQALLSVAPVATPDGRQAVVVARDVTDLRALDRMRTQLLHMLSHEIRAPLLPLTGYLEVALRGMAGPLNDAQADLVRRAHAVSRQLAGRVQDLSSLLANEDASEFAVEIAPVDIARLIASAVEEVELLASEHGLQLHVTVAPRLPHIAGNAERLGQVVRNLLNNALKFTPRGGHVWVEASAGAEMLEISVADSGCGIAGEHVPYIFERFYQAPAGQGLRTGAGQGLGLAIVQLIVSRHGGRVQVHSQPGQGSRFTVQLPLSSPPGAPTVAPRARAWPPPEAAPPGMTTRARVIE